MSSPIKQAIEKGSDAWNVAQGYTTLKILKPLVEMDKLVKVARYGCENIEETPQINSIPGLKAQMRVDAINRMVDILREVFENDCDKEFICSWDEVDKQDINPEDIAMHNMLNAIKEYFGLFYNKKNETLIFINYVFYLNM